MRVCTVIGARPQFVKAAAVSAKIAESTGLEEVIVHTGQHYDESMSEIFFRELDIPLAKHNLEVGSGSHGAQTGRMLEKLETLLERERPDCVLTYGDTNSTLAAALTAVKSQFPVAHVEAGMRSFNRKMPEEINRVVTDHVVEINFCSNQAAVDNLRNEGRGETAVLVGDVMIDCCRRFTPMAEKHCQGVERFGVEPGGYLVMTCHRPENTNHPERLKAILKAAAELAKGHPVVCPVHPRLRDYMSRNHLEFSEGVRAIQPQSYLEMLVLQKNALILLTDSGGMQKEAFFHGVPCVTMRDETEWGETVELGWNKVVGADFERIVTAAEDFLRHRPAPPARDPYGDGDAAGKVVAFLLEWFERKTKAGSGR